MSTRFLKDPKVRRVIRAEGNDAIPVFLALLSEAMLQESGGHVELTYDQLAMDGFTDEEKARAIVLAGHGTGFLVLDKGDDYEFHLHFPAWSRHQAAFRKAKSRATQNPHDKANVTPSHEQVTPGHKKSPTGQDKTGQHKTEQESEIVPIPDTPLSDLLADLIEGNGAKRPTVTRKWADAERLMLERDDRNAVEAERLIRWCQNDEFWRGNILSMPKFREKYDQLLLQAKRSKRDSSPGMTQAERRAAEIQARRAA